MSKLWNRDLLIELDIKEFKNGKLTIQLQSFQNKDRDLLQERFVIENPKKDKQDIMQLIENKLNDFIKD